MNDSATKPQSVELLLNMTGIQKSFPGVQALSGGSFDLRAGEIHALVGENGAGKSTLIKILTGAQSADAGVILLSDKQVNFKSPVAAHTAGISAIYQEFTLVPMLSVRENLFLGTRGSRIGWLDVESERQASVDILAKLGIALDPDAIVSALTVAQQQMVEIARAMLFDCRILVMDEPTAALAPREVDRLFELLRELAGRGVGLIFVSHRLDEILAISDRITVMRDGVTVACRTTGEWTRASLIEQMVGRSLDQEFPRVAHDVGETCLEISGLSGGKVCNVSISARRGEILGIAGLMGAGRSELARLIFGADQREGGEIKLNGRVLDIRSPRDAIRAGICLLTEDRKGQGLVLNASSIDNFALSNLSRWSKAGFINESTERSRFLARVEQLNIRIADPEQRAANLSGGNQQKLLVARWLETESQVVIFDEPTRGIDVGAKYDMYLLIGELAKQGKSVIVISSELPEILGICDRVLVIKQGSVSGEITGVRSATQEQIMAMAV